MGAPLGRALGVGDDRVDALVVRGAVVGYAGCHIVVVGHADAERVGHGGREVAEEVVQARPHAAWPLDPRRREVEHLWWYRRVRLVAGAAAARIVAIAAARGRQQDLGIGHVRCGEGEEKEEVEERSGEKAGWRPHICGNPYKVCLRREGYL